MSDEAYDGNEVQRRPIEASLAQALAWGAPAWILDQDGPPPRDRSSREGRARFALCVRRERHRNKRRTDN